MSSVGEVRPPLQLSIPSLLWGQEDHHPHTHWWNDLLPHPWKLRVNIVSIMAKDGTRLLLTRDDKVLVWLITGSILHIEGVTIHGMHFSGWCNGRMHDVIVELGRASDFKWASGGFIAYPSFVIVTHAYEHRCLCTGWSFVDFVGMQAVRSMACLHSTRLRFVRSTIPFCGGWQAIENWCYIPRSFRKVSNMVDFNSMLRPEQMP